MSLRARTNAVGEALRQAVTDLEALMWVADLAGEEEFASAVRELRERLIDESGLLCERIHARIKTTINAKLAELEAMR